MTISSISQAFEKSKKEKRPALLNLYSGWRQY